VRLQGRIAPVVARRLLGFPGGTFAGGLEQHPGGRGVELRVIARRQAELATRSTRIVAIIINEGS
jgi:hypothetical protein